MVCRKEGLAEDANSKAAMAASASDALILATMCIIDLPVDVHAKDGSVYSGIFHTACVDNDYAIVLKKARMTKKGNRGSNVMNGSLVETLIVRSEDLVQVVAKGVSLPANGITGNVGGDPVKDIADINECLKREVKAREQNAPDGDKKNLSQTRQVWIGSQENPSDCRDKPEFLEEKTTDEVRASTLCTLDKEIREKPSSKETAYSEAPRRDIYVTTTPNVDVASESLVSSSSTSARSVPPNVSSFSRSAKESKLNPGAKIFSPSLLYHRPVTPPVGPTGASVAYIPDHRTMVPIATAQPEVDISSFTPHSSVALKFVSRNNLVTGNGGTETPYVQPFIGQVVSRTQPVRYAGQYHHNLQARPAYVYPNPQNVMVGRVGPLVCMHPISNDVVQGPAGLSQATMRPLLTPHHLPKHQGNAASQSLQLFVNTPFIASGQQPFAMPTPVPISQPYFPVIQPVPVPRSTGYFGTKLA